MKRIYFYSISLFVFAGISSCVRYHPPPVNTPMAEKWKEPVEETAKNPVCPDPERVLKEAEFRPWWKVFNDEQLNALEYEAIKQSPTVQGQIAQLEQAIAFYGIEYANLFPNVTLDLGAQRQRFSQTEVAAGGTANTPTGGASPAGGGIVAKGGPMMPLVDPQTPSNPCPPPMCSCPPPPTPKTPAPITRATTLTVLPTLTWTLDVWGQNLQAAESAKEQIRAQQQALQQTLLVLTTSVCDSYLQVRTYDLEIDILERTLKTRDHNYNLNNDQYTAGLINDLAVQQAKSDLESVAASVEDTRRLRALQEHLLADLVGQPAAIFSLEKDLKIRPALPQIAPSVPPEVLKSRPDILQVEHQMKAASLAVGVQLCNYFPNITITADYGFISSKANKLFKWKSHVWLAAIDALTPIFTAGQIASEVDQAIAQYKQTVASYISTCLACYQQVEDALFSVEAVKKQLYHLHLDVVASQAAYDIALMRYRMGLENYLTVVDSERTLLDAERTEIQIARSQYSTTVSLIRSIGGSWASDSTIALNN